MSTDAISSALATTTSTGTSSQSEKSSLTAITDKETFLTLLITQLQYQDPMSPQDPEEFVAQLAQFSSLEQLTNLNDSITSLNKLQTSANSNLENVQALSLLGKTVQVEGDSLTVQDGQSRAGSFNLAADAQKVQVTIYDASGNVVRNLSLESLTSGNHSLDWDGKNNNGETVSDGTYTFAIAAQDAEGQNVQASCYYTGKVEGIAWENNTAKLRIGERLFSLTDIVSATDAS
ncbi:MAG: flagellar hook capping FlgD N-terminal domain-containing protein [Desulfobacca sp.]|nr:flagellar hook capping FlgD N-terminal domain-containing protein [Desulfobacca sp.]